MDSCNRETLARYADAAFQRDRDIVRGLLDRPDRIPFVSRYGATLFNFWQDADRPRGLWRRCDEASYRAADPAWRVLLDLDALAESEGEDWVWRGAAILPRTHDRAIVQLSRSGGDAVTLREFDLCTCRFVDGGFALPEAKGYVRWLDRDALLLMSAYGPDMATRAGYARAVRLWPRGTDPLGATVLFETGSDSISASGSADRQTGEERVLFGEQIGLFEWIVHVGDRGGARLRLDLPCSAGWQLHRDQLSVRLRQSWQPGSIAYESDTVLVIALSDFLAGSRDFAVLWAPRAGQALRGVMWSAGRAIVHILEDLRPLYAVYELQEDGSWRERPLPGLPALGTVGVWPLDAHAEESDGSLLATVSDPLTPTTLLAFPQTLAAPTVLRRGTATFDAAGLRVTRHDAVSADGTRVPYVQVGPATESGEAPVHITGYGGFRQAVLPTYNSVLGRLWLERGGTCVSASLRGGGEFGTAWHEAGRRAGKAHAHDDFAAVAADLARRGVTRPDRIAAEGGSNGGLLIANMLTRYPDCFGALLCTVPLVDMRRYSKLLAGASWIDEYGDPDDPADWAFLRAISAYHVAEAGRPYPPILLVTSRRDDRVHPGHARKMAAKLRGFGYDASFYEPAAGGHGAGKDNAERAAFLALGLRFLRERIGWH